MSVYFKSLRSSSSGNCMLIWTDDTQVVIDCGFKSQRDCEQLLGKHAGRLDDIDAVIVSHNHSDHIGYPSLRVLSSYHVRIKAHQRVVKQILSKHCCGDWDEPPRLQPFHDKAFKVGDLRITPIELPHAPSFPTFGFVIYHGEGKQRRKMVVCTDFYDYGDVLQHFMDADFIFIESNHDLDLLRENPNYASRFHLSNPKTARLLYHAGQKSQHPPQVVMLGHLSLERNREELALDAVKEFFDRQRTKMEFRLYTAPLYEPCRAIRID